MRYPTKSAFFAIIGLCAIGQVAMAADIPVRKAAPAPVYVPYNWNGWYVGAHLGYGWGDKSWSPAFIAPFTVDHDFDGWLGGFQTGWNYQSGNWLFGIEGEWSWTALDGSGGNSLFPAFGFSAEVDWVATLTARVGLVNDRWLWYVKGGGAWVKESFSIALPAGFGAEDTRSGWTVGLGVEYAWGNNWTSKLEYSFIDLKDRNLGFGALGGASIEQDVHVVKVGLNYKFDWGKTPAAIPARY